MRGFHRHGLGGKPGRHWRGELDGAIWMVGIGIMMLWGHWWPGILVLIGISMVLGAFWRGPEKGQMDEQQRPYMPPPPPPPARNPFPPVEFNRPGQPMPAPAPANPGPRIELLPATCPRCGAPVRSPDVKWRGNSFAACAYCGSNVIVVKPIKS